MTDHPPGTTPTRRLVFGMTPMAVALVVLILTTVASSGTAIYLLVRDRDDARDAAGTVAGQSQRLVDCVRRPAATPRQCEQAAAQVENTIEDEVVDDPAIDVTPVPVPEDGDDGQDGTDGDDGADGDDGRRGPQGPRGRTGPTGPPGPAGPSCVDELGIDACRGPAGPSGPQGESITGPRGPEGPPGPAGTSGTAQPGTYTCPDGQYVAGFAVGDAGGVTLDCRDLPAALIP
ncbi:collagen-like protein [Microcystis phage MinS1]|nr:collagen-like protein [Microcystis phage MinS1]